MHQRHGFTLIELLIVIVILGLLAAIATSFFWDAKDRALLKSMESDLRNLAAQQELYFPGALSYAANVVDLTDFQQSPGVVITINSANSLGWAAQATHPSYAGHTCGIIIGNAPAADGAPATVPGVITCD
ncbi:MAG TPA: prepilin-type N-terminal cleavage/methylation domain-containing protein [Longimicrobiales bacterium]|nr:prepilin-type N-terminal cleavage/methylation domain-containing protein [Longimicrobiales bacterium]